MGITIVRVPSGRSTLDLYGRSFVLLRLGNVPTAHIEKAAKDRGVPLTVAALDEPDVLAAYQRKLVLVRPDGHVAWRADSAALTLVRNNMTAAAAIATAGPARGFTERHAEAEKIFGVHGNFDSIIKSS